MKNLIEDRLLASLKFGANTGDRSEQAVCGNQMREAANTLSDLRSELTASIAREKRLREYTIHPGTCDYWAPEPPGDCTCGLDALLKER